MGAFYIRSATDSAGALDLHVYESFFLEELAQPNFSSFTICCFTISISLRLYFPGNAFIHFISKLNREQRYGTVRGEDVPFCLGLPLTPLFPYNYTQQDIQTSRILIHYLANFIQTGYVSLFPQFHASIDQRQHGMILFLFHLVADRNPNGDATPTTKHSIDLESLKRLGSNSHYTESLPAPSSLSSSADAVLMSSKQQQQQTSEHPPPSVSTVNNGHNNAVIAGSENDGRIVVVETIQQQQQSQFIHHALSSANNRHRRSLTATGSSSSNRRLISKRYVVKRNFPNNQLSKVSDEMDADDSSNETELDGIDEGENDDYIEREEAGEEDEKKQEKQLNVLNGHDRLDGDDNEGDLGKSMKLFVPYWDAYDTVNQLFLEISKYTCNNHHHSSYIAQREREIRTHLSPCFGRNHAQALAAREINCEQYV